MICECDARGWIESACVNQRMDMIYECDSRGWILIVSVSTAVGYDM